MNWKDVEGSSHDLIKVHSWHFLGGTDEKHGNISQDYQRPAKIQIQVCSEYVSTAVLLHKSVQAHMQLVLAARQKWTAHSSCHTRNQECNNSVYPIPVLPLGRAQKPQVSNPQPARFYFVACGHICKLRICYKNHNNFWQSGTPIISIFSHVSHKPAHNKWHGPLP